MTTFYLDPEGGNDANAGTSFALRWKTFQTGATAARIAPGDVIRVMASPDPTLVGTCDWTRHSSTITLPSAKTLTLDNCDATTGWTASANVTITANTTNEKEGTASIQMSIAAGFTTGKLAYKDFGSAQDLSAYQQISWWMVGPATALEVRFCSDASGETAVFTYSIPANTLSTTVWNSLVFNNGATLGTTIRSISFWATTDPGTTTIRLDNIIACKAASDPDSLTHNSLIGKVHNLKWEASTAYSLNDKRIPTPPNRNGWCYKVTTAGTSGASEPTWPNREGATVTDGSVVWTCEELEDTWYPIRSIDGTTLRLDMGSTYVNAADTRGYAGATESVATYKREPFTPTINTGNLVATDNGTGAASITYSGGWNTTDMSTQTGETWLSNRGGASNGITTSGSGVGNYIEVENIHVVRYSVGIATRTGQQAFRNVSAIGCYTSAYSITTGPVQTRFTGCKFNNNAAGVDTGAVNATFERCRIENNQTTGLVVTGASGNSLSETLAEDCYIRNNGTIGITLSEGRKHVFLRPTFGNNGTAAVSDLHGLGTFVNASLGTGETTFISAKTANYESYTYSWQHGRAANTHVIEADGGTIASAVDQRNTASGISWKFSITATHRGALNPLVLRVAKIKCASGVAKSITIWTRRDSANIKGALVCRGGQLAGVAHQEVSCQPATNTWVESSALTFTPSEDGVVEIEFWVWDGTGTTNNFWIDDLTVT